MRDSIRKQGWRKVRFDQIAGNVTERVDPAQAAEEGVEYYVGLEHLDSESLKIRRWGSPDDVIGTKFRFKKGDIIFGRRRCYQRKLAVAEFDGICSAHAMVVRAKEDTVLKEFLPFFMQSDVFMERAVQISVGSLSPTINWKTLRRQEFALPPKSEQRRIANILWAADQAVESSLQALAAMKTVIDMAIEGFLHAGFSRRETGVVHTAIGPIPSGWQYSSCEDLFDVPPKNGVSPTTNAMGEGYPTLSISAVQDGRIIPEGNLKFAEISPEELAQYRLRAGDLLVVRGNGNRELTARCGIVEHVPENCFYPDLLIRISFAKSKMIPEFACLEWNAPSVHRRLLAFAKTTSGIWKVNGKDLRRHKLIVPPLAEQQLFLGRIKSLRHGQNVTATNVDSARRLKSALTDRLLSKES